MAKDGEAAGFLCRVHRKLKLAPTFMFWVL